MTMCCVTCASGSSAAGEDYHHYAPRRGAFGSADPETLSRASIALFQGFMPQKPWYPKIAPNPYLNALDALLAGLLVKKGSCGRTG